MEVKLKFNHSKHDKYIWDIWIHVKNIKKPLENQSKMIKWVIKVKKLVLTAYKKWKN